MRIVFIEIVNFRGIRKLTWGACGGNKLPHRTRRLD